MGNRIRTNRINIYLSDDEIRLLDAKFKLSGAKSRSAFLRNLIIYGFNYDIDYSDLHEYSVALTRIGTRINQIVKLANISGKVSNDDIKDIKELLEKIWHTHESMLSKQPLVNR